MAYATAHRNKALDILKILALVMMTVDHLKYALPEHKMQLLLLGRWAFPLFAMILAYNVCRAIQEGRTATLKTYFFNLVLFSVISEIPYQLMAGADRNELNIMPTLLLGFLLILAMEWKRGVVWKGLVLWFLSVLYIAAQEHFAYGLEYGVQGLWLIAAMYGAFRYEGNARAYNVFVALTMMVVCVFDTSPVLIISTLMATGFGYALLLKSSDDIVLRVPRVGKWAYWYYPLHMLIIYAMARIIL